MMCTRTIRYRAKRSKLFDNDCPHFFVGDHAGVARRCPIQPCRAGPLFKALNDSDGMPILWWLTVGRVLVPAELTIKPWIL